VCFHDVYGDVILITVSKLTLKDFATFDKAFASLKEPSKRTLLGKFRTKPFENDSNEGLFSFRLKRGSDGRYSDDDLAKFYKPRLIILRLVSWARNPIRMRWLKLWALSKLDSGSLHYE